MKPKIDIIFEDNDIIVINKPSGLLTIPDRYNHLLPSAISYLKSKYDECFVVHRLDKDTSGVIVFAKNAEAHRRLNLQFDNQQVKKIYHAIVQGILQNDELEVDIPLIQNPNGIGVLPSIRGKECLSIIKVLERFKVASLVEVNLVTGRQHQLRAHVAAIGHPLLVDDLYGENSEFMLSSIKRRYNLKKNTDEKPIISRISMHSCSIEFTHPSSNEVVKFEAAYPKDFEATLEVLRKYAKL